MKVGNWHWAYGVAVAGMLLGTSCAQNVPDIDRTQPNKVEKALFQNDDEWYYRQTIIDTDQVANSGGIGVFEAFEGSLYRVRWTVTEDMLYAMSTVEPADGVLEGQIEEGNERIGVVAAFPIQGHFDVERAYSTATGEQTNVIIENGQDRHWYERKYMRVDWSTNLAGTLSQVGGYAGYYSAVDRDIPQEADVIDPDRTRLTDDYIDTVTEYYYEPDLYACYTTLGFDSIYSCEGGPLRVRNSFVKVPEKETYIPLEYTDNAYVTDGDSESRRLYTMSIYDPSLQKVFEVQCDDYAKNFERDEFGASTEDACTPATFDLFTRFGYFRTERVAWDNRRGAAYEPSRRYYANRWNIWQSMLDDNGEELPMSERTPKPVVYYTNPEYPRDMWEPAQRTAKQWDNAFLETVALAKGISVDDVRTELVAEYGEGNDYMYAIKWNSCSAPMLQEWVEANGTSEGNDRMDVPTLVSDFMAKWGGSSLEDAVWSSPSQAQVEFCAELEYATEPRDENAFSWQRVGDLRYSFFNWVEEEVPWSGYGPSAADPLTGQIISGNANYAGNSLAQTAAYGADLVMYMNGTLEHDEVAYGDHVRDYLVEQMKRARQTNSQELSPEGKRALASRAGLSPDEVSPTGFQERPSIDELPHFIHQHGVDGVQAAADRNSLANVQAKASDTRLADFYQTPEVQNFLMQDPNFRVMVESSAAAQYGPNWDQDDLNQAYVDVASPNLMHGRLSERNKLMMENNIMLHENQLRAMESLVTYAGIQEAYKDASREEIERVFRENIFVGTQLHEIGHTVGLRHNFSSSMDALNYHDEYWEIQKRVAMGELDPDDRWTIQGELANDIAGKDVEYLNQSEFQLGSVMDYTGDLTGRFAGLGKYDKAAVHFAYAEMVEQWKPNSELSADHGVAQLNNFYGTEMWLSDYSELPRILANAGGSGPASDSETQLRGIDVILNGREWVPVKEAVEQYRNGVLTNSENWKNGQFAGGTEPWIDRTVPYEFCTDDRANYSLGCDVFDFGANHREIVNHQFAYYRVMQPFARYSRGKINRLYENVNGYANFVYRVLKSVERPFRFYSYYQWYDLGAYTDDLREASIDAINFYSELMALAEPGPYCMFGSDTSVSQYWWYDLENTFVPARWDRNDGNCQNKIEVAKGPGQFFNYEYTDEYDFRITRVGTFVDKSLATQALFQISSNFIDSSFFTDFRATNISYWTLFQDEMLGFLRGVILGDYNDFAGVYNKQTGSYESPRLVDAKTFGLGLPSDQVAMDRIYSTVSFGHEFNLLVGAMIYNTTWQDRYTDFGQYVKLAVTTGESQPFPEDTELHEFVHPVTNQVYTAAQTDDGKSISVEMVSWANTLALRYIEARDNLEAQEPGTQAYSDARETLEGRSQQLEDVVAKMDMVRYVYDALGASALR